MTPSLSEVRGANEKGRVTLFSISGVTCLNTTVIVVGSV